MSRVIDLCVFWNYLSPPSINLTFLNRGDLIRNIAIKIDDAFNDSRASITVGTTAEQDLYVKAADVNCNVYGDYRVLESFEEPNDVDNVYLFINKAASIRGHGNICYTIVRHL